MRFNFLHFILLFFIISINTGFSEGTKELMPNEGNPTRILLDPAPGRVPFALYSSRANPDYRLYIHIENPATERIYFGLGQQRNSNNNTIESKVNWRIHPPDLPDVDECSGLTPIKNTLPTLPDVGYISTYQEAFNGPNNINPSGYNPLVCSPTHGPGDYFLTIQATATRTFDFADITVVNIANSPPTVIPGRVFSKCWQIRNPQNGFNWFTFEGDMFIYSNDGIVTKLDPNGMEGRDFAVSCNESGCYPVAPPYNAQQARQSRGGPNPHNYPQFKIFLNNPDVTAYPDGIIGQLVDGSVVATSNCINGTVSFDFETTPLNAIGTVEIILGLSSLFPPLADRILITNNVPGGNYTVVWDGLDGVGNQVPSGSTFPFTLRYTNGLTNMPLWDVEDNANGFIVNLVRPVLVPPLADPAFYWDDALVGGGQMLNPPGCTVPPSTSCHAWTGDWGDQKTINTWWYLVSNSTANVNITYKKGPGILAATAPLPPNNSVCPGGTMTFTVNPDPNTMQYHWSWDGGNMLTTATSISITFPINAIAGPSNVSVYGSNTDCGDGQTTLIPVTILPVPDLITLLTQTTCSGVPFSITLNSSPPATTYTWNVAPGDCSANIQTCPTGNSTGVALTGNLSVTNLNQGSVNYHITPLGQCSGAIKIMTVSVDPKPNVTSPSGVQEPLCSGGTTNIVLQSGLTGPSLTWSWVPVCTNILACPAQGISSTISNTLALTSNALPGSVVYSIIPTFGGCSGDPYLYTVNVLQLPDVQLAQFAPVCLNTPPFALTGGTPAGPGGVYTIGGNPITMFDPVVFGAGTFPVTYTYTNVNGCISSDQKDIIVQSLITPTLSGNAAACVGVSENFITDPNMVAASYVWTVTPDGIISGALPDVKTITWPTTGIKTITVTYTDPNGCMTIPATKTVTVNPLPVPTILTGNFNACFQKTYTYTTQPGKLNYTWNVSPGNTVIFTDHTATVTWNVIGNEWIEVNYFDANGCTAVIPTRVPVIVNPSPVFVVNGNNSVCAGSTTTYQLQGAEVGNWTLTSGGSIVPPVNNVNSITVNWTAGTTLAQASITVDYVNALGCNGTTTRMIDIQPLPVTSFTTTTPSPVCQDFPTPSQYTVTPGGAAATYQWLVTPAANAVIANPTANPAVITWALTGNFPQTALLTLTATTSATIPACTSTSSPLAITINPKPATQMNSCFDQVTTLNGKPILLKGGTPLGLNGHYSIDQTNGTPVTYFNALSAGPGLHTIFYGYTNNNGCIAYASKQITVMAQPGFICGSLLTDVRDSKTYKTVQIGSQCWMQENLRYSAAAPYVSTSFITPQTDNCTFERYCLSSDPNCTLYGGLYQWDELMQYNTDVLTTRQGFCPPGWHVPTENEWNTLIDVVSQNVGSGVAGAYLKDLSPSSLFKANPGGIFYLNTIEAFTANSMAGVFFWTSNFDAVSGKAIARGLNSKNPSTSRYEATKADAFPIRCIKD